MNIKITKSEVFSFLDNLSSKRIVMMDGAMGTMIQKYRFEEEDYRGKEFKNHKTDLKGNNDILNITNIDSIKDVHKKYILSGADIIETNTFNGTSIAQQDYNLQNYVDEINKSAVKAAKEAIKETASLVNNKRILISKLLTPIS